MTNENDICADMQSNFDSWELSLKPLSTSVKTQMRDHFDSCENCQRWLSEWELVKLSARELPQIEVPTSVLSQIMAKIEAPDAVKIYASDTWPVASPVVSVTPVAAVVKVGDLQLLPPLIKSDSLIGIAAFAALLISSIHYGAEGFEGIASWFLSFFILFGAHQVLKGKEGVQVQKI